MKRIIATVMALAIILSLAACGTRDEAVTVNGQTEAATTVTTRPPQQEMPTEEKEAALRRLEYALLCAAMEADDRQDAMENLYVGDRQAFLGDYNGDGAEDLILNQYAHTFNIADRVNSYQFSQGGLDLFTDKAGTLYLRDSMGGGGGLFELDGVNVESYGQDTWYTTWNGSEWHTVLRNSEGGIKEVITDENGWFVSYGKTISEENSCQIDGQSVSKEDYEAYLKTLDLARLETTPADLLQNRFDGIYTDDLLAALEQTLSDFYGCQRISADIDGDGSEEALFFVSNIAQPWLNCMEYGPYDDAVSAGYYFSLVIDPQRPRTCVLVADQQGSELVVDALCAPADLNVRAVMEVSKNAGFLWLDGQAVYLPGNIGQADPGLLTQYVQMYGYSDCLIKAADVSEIAGAEYLCLCQKDGVWYLLIFVFEGGDFRPIYSLDLTNTAVYLVESDGKQCLLTYSQRIETTMGGQIRTNYDYNVLRFDGEGYTESLDYQSVGYYDNDADATAVAAFFERLNVYLVKILVLRDPYRLTGRMWMKPEETEYGTAPKEPGQAEETRPNEQTEEPVMGFVQINDPSSWLNLREGPGTEYARVLVDPDNPESFVKQALGSPVTVLETVETGDTANPVWVKVRISYADREIVGYSSKTYIRIPGKE